MGPTRINKNKAVIDVPKRKITLASDGEVEIEVKEEPLVREVSIVQDLEEILTLLPMGTNLPVWPEFVKYVKFDLNHFNAHSLVIKENGNIVGQTVVFYADNKTLYFGFFGVSNDAQDRIEFLIDKLIEFGSEEGFETLKGPVNVPTIIYGWGFMEEGSSTSLIVHKPVNSPLYPIIFRQRGFTEVLKEDSFEGVFDESTSDRTEGFTYDDYELVVFDTWEEILNVKMEFLKLNMRNLSPRSVVTPSSANVFDNYLEFIKHYGDPSMMVFIRYKKTSKFIGCLVATPNPFDKSSCVLFTIGVDKKHRNKGIGWWMMKEVLSNCLKLGINSCIVIVGSHVVGGRQICVTLGFNVTRTHTVFSYSLPKNKGE